MTRAARALRILDVLLTPLVWPSALLLRRVRQWGVANMPISKAVLQRVGMFPIRDHYYEPLFHPARLWKPLEADRDLPGIDLNVEGQLEFLGRFGGPDELTRFPMNKAGEFQYYYNNAFFGPGDAEYLYHVIRTCKPSRVIEIGSGLSTLMARHAIEKNKQEEPQYSCAHLCVEPYEHPWLESLGIQVIREPVERLDVDLFRGLGCGDVLFIDSSHVLRPQGDVAFEYLEVLPILAPGVLVHVHDVFTPRDYPRAWLVDEVRLWNEQYVLEAFLCHNSAFEIVGALNFLSHHYPERLGEKCPVFGAHRGAEEPGSFWLRRRVAAGGKATRNGASGGQSMGSPGAVRQPEAPST